MTTNASDRLARAAAAVRRIEERSRAVEDDVFAVGGDGDVLALVQAGIGGEVHVALARYGYTPRTFAADFAARVSPRLAYDTGDGLFGLVPTD
jgi:hypothetical protein